MKISEQKEESEIGTKATWRELWLTANRQIKSIYVAHFIFFLAISASLLGTIIFYEKNDGGWQGQYAESIFVCTLLTSFLAFIYSLRGGWRSFLINIISFFAAIATILVITTAIQSFINEAGNTPGKITACIFLLIILSGFDFFMLGLIRRLSGLQKPSKPSAKHKEKLTKNVPEVYRNPDFESFINDPIVARFVGKNFEHYKQLWANDFEDSGDIRRAAHKYHINWLALLTTCPTWFGYRKMYKMAFVYIALICTASLSMDFLGWDNRSSSYLGANLVFMLMTKSLYLDHAWKFYHKNKKLPRTTLDHLIREKGGTSIQGSVAMTLVTFLALAAVTVLGDTFHR